MFKDGLKKVARGLTMVEELRRVVPPDESDEAEAAPVPARPATPSTAGASSRKRILIVDDDRTTVLVTSAMLAKDNYEVISATDGHQALTILYNQHPDLVLTDLNMPGMNGFDLVKRVRGDLALSQTPIILMTTDGDVAKRASESGADDFVLKPLVRDALLAQIRKVLLNSVLAKSSFAPPG
ncbi:MAG TPA: response regulator, partial [Blastocatellia bacterium]|nr:response regulator [Blastocatellia bacterium]